MKPQDILVPIVLCCIVIVMLTFPVLFGALFAVCVMVGLMGYGILTLIRKARKKEAIKK